MIIFITKALYLCRTWMIIIFIIQLLIKNCRVIFFRWLLFLIFVEWGNNKVSIIAILFFLLFLTALSLTLAVIFLAALYISNNIILSGYFREGIFGPLHEISKAASLFLVSTGTKISFPSIVKWDLSIPLLLFRFTFTTPTTSTIIKIFPGLIIFTLPILPLFLGLINILGAGTKH